MDGSLLREKSTSNQGLVRLRDGTYVPIKRCEKVILPNEMELSNVLHVPKFQSNLLPVSKLARECNCSLTLVADYCVIQDLPSRTLIGVGRHQDTLYLLGPMKGEGVAMKVSKSVDEGLWHVRLGHASDSKMAHVEPSLRVVKNKMPCDSCI